MNYNDIEKNNLVVFKSIRGSHLYNLNTETSDIDTFGVYCCPLDNLLGTGLRYQRIVADETQDNYYDELQKYFIELGKSNPDVLISLYTPEDKILIKNPSLQPLFDMRDSLLTQECFKSFSGYARSQINKMYGLQKAMNIEPEEVQERKNPLYFCWVPRPGNTGAWTLEKWLRENGLKQEHCGISRIPNGRELYQLWYDWFADKDLKLEDYARLKHNIQDWDLYKKLHPDIAAEIIEELHMGRQTEMIMYRGIIDPGAPTTTQLRSSSIPKYEAPNWLVCFQYNDDAFKKHCNDYKRYWDWVKHRNQARYQSNVGHQWDAKNTMHCLRIMKMATEIAEGKGMILDRKYAGDREFLLQIKHHQFSFEEVKEFVHETEENMKSAFMKSQLPLEPDKEQLENLIIEIRHSIYNKRSI